MAWRYDLPKCPVSPEDRGEFMKPSNLALLPCPFCCGKAAFVIGMKKTVRTVDVICQDCGGAMPAFCEDDAAADWNIRPAPSSVSTPAQDKRPHKTMTPEEYAAMPLQGWHQVCRDVDGFGGIGIRYMGLSTPSASAGPQAEAVAWLCTDDRYSLVNGHVATLRETVDLWRESGIRHEPLGVIRADFQQQPTPQEVQEACAQVADRHKGSYARRPNYKTLMRSASPEALEEIRAEERGEDIAAEMIAKSIRSLIPPAQPQQADGRGSKIQSSDGSGVRQEDSARSHGESLQQGPDTSSNPSTAATPHGKGSGAASVANPAAASDRPSHAATGPSETIVNGRKGVTAQRETFIIPEGYEAVRDSEGRATGEIVRALKDAKAPATDGVGSSHTRPERGSHNAD